MRLNYFRTSWRKLWKNRAITFINLFGLSIGITASVFIFLWVQNELSFNGYHPEKENIYRITNTLQVSSNEAWKWENSPMLFAETAEREIPEIQLTARVIINSWGGPVFKIGNRLFTEKTGAYVDKSWFSIFHYDFVSGNLEAFNNDPFSIVLTESKAKKYFGTEDPLEKIIRVDTINYTVKAVIRDNPIHSSFQFDVLMQMDGRLLNPGTYRDGTSWGNFGYITFLKLHSGANSKRVERALNDIIRNKRSNDNCKVSLKPLDEIYFENDLQSSDLPHGKRQTTYIFGLLGFLLLVIGCINYVNLTTAHASLRANEVSIRKIVGASKVNLFAQFITESMVISLLSLIISLFLIQLLLPGFNALTEKQFDLPILSPVLWAILAIILLFASLLNGIYPALLLSSFEPLKVFRGRSVLKLQDGSVRKGLVVFQFILSVILLVATMVIFRQMQFVQTTNPGYSVAQVMSVQVPFQSYRTLTSEARLDFFAKLKSELKAQNSIYDVCTGSSEIVNIDGSSSGNADWDGRDSNFNPTIAKLSADDDFQRMFGLKLVSGSWFGSGSGEEHGYLLNETAARLFNMKLPITGQRFIWGGDTGTIIGILKDFHYKSMHDRIGPMVVSNNKGGGSYLFIKTVPGNIPKAIRAVESIWTRYVPGQPFSYTFLDDNFNSMYKAEVKAGKLVLIFSVIAVLISALGLFGLAAFSAGQRIKEIGIRKVLGASVFSLWGLLSKEFLFLVFVSCLIGIPVAYYFMQQWLQNFEYRIRLVWWIFGAAGSGAMAITILTVSFQTIKAAWANPVKSLRSE